MLFFNYNISMRMQYNLLNFPYDFPLKISLTKISGEERDWHKTLKIVFLLEGECNYYQDNSCVRLSVDDILIINPFIIYEIKGLTEVVFLEVDVNLTAYGFSLDEVQSMYFNCNSALEKEKNKFHTLRETIYALIQANMTIKENIDVLNRTLAYQLLYLLLSHYKNKGETIKRRSQKNLEKIKDIINYIDLNYQNNLSLNELSEHFGYTPQYFSSFFNSNMNKNFQSYYDNLRVNKSLEDLVNTDLPIEDIASINGFNDYRSYIRAFKKMFNLTPSEFKKQKGIINKEKNFYLDFDKKDYLDIIFKNIKKEALIKPSTTINNFAEYNINYNDKTELIRKTFLNVISVSRASDILKIDIVNMLERTKKIGFKYIRFHGLLNDDMHVYRVNKNGDINISFVYVDKVIDTLLNLGFKPFITLDYMPMALANLPNKQIFESRQVVSEPKNISDWLFLIKTLFEHLINKYGLTEVLSWPISIWNQPDSTVHAFGFSKDELFYELYKETYNLIKSINQAFQVGTPSLIPFASFAYDWDINYLEYCKENNVYPDFLAINYYSNDFDFFITGKKLEKLNKNPNNLKQFINKIKTDNLYIGNKIYLTEWNVTSSQRNFINDTIYLSCYIVKNILENMDSLECFSHWSLTDFLDETQLPNTTFHGGNGLFTYNGIPKASFYAYYFLSKLENNVLQKGEGYYITKGLNKLTLIIYNYEHFSDYFADGEYFSLRYHHRYEPFQERKVKKLHFIINNLNYKNAKIKISRINKESGSSYDIYETMADLELEDEVEVKSLDNLSIPKYYKTIIPIKNNILEYDVDLEPLEVKLIEIDLLN